MTITKGVLARDAAAFMQALHALDRGDERERQRFEGSLRVAIATRCETTVVALAERCGEPLEGSPRQLVALARLVMVGDDHALADRRVDAAQVRIAIQRQILEAATRNTDGSAVSARGLLFVGVEHMLALKDPGPAAWIAAIEAAWAAFALVIDDG